VQYICTQTVSKAWHIEYTTTGINHGHGIVLFNSMDVYI